MSYVNDIKAFLDAYEWPDVKSAIKQIALEKYSILKGDRAELEGSDEEWSTIAPYEDLPDLIDKFREERLDWRVVNGMVQMRRAPEYISPEQPMETKSEQKSGGKKADLSMQMTDKICITCGGTLALEPICGGCRLGRMGFAFRYVCTEDMDHEFYVLREGIILPNQGD